MVHLRPPLMSKGQADDFYAYSVIGTGLFWLAGGLATGPVAATMALCAAGAAINHAPRTGNNPNMQWTTPTGPPPFPNDMPPEPRQYVVEREKELEQRFGMNAVYCYRTMIYEGQALGPAFETLWNSLAHLKSQGYWRNGQIQGNAGETPKQLLDRITGRRVASPESQKAFEAFLQHMKERGVGDAGRMRISVIAYILGLEPVTDKPVRRIKVWSNCRHYEQDRRDEQGHYKLPMYYVSDWKWYYYDDFWRFRDLYKKVIECYVSSDSLLEEAEGLFHYRVEEHISEGPPGHPDPNGERMDFAFWKELFFGRTELYPATEEDMRGLP